MTSRLSSIVERWISRTRGQAKSTSKPQLQSSLVQLEPMILLSASPLAELDLPGESTMELELDDGYIRGWAVSSEPVMMRYDHDQDDPDVDPGGGDEGGTMPDLVFEHRDVMDLSGERGDHLEVNHSNALELEQGTIALSFNADNVWGRRTLFSKDYSGNRDGGDLSAFIRDGRLEVRFQSAEKDVWLKTEPGSIEEGQDYQLTLTFGEDGFWLYLNGKMKAWDTDFTQGLEQNTQDLAIGANTWARNPDYPNKTWDYFDGRISDFMIFDSQYDRNEVATLAGFPPEPPLSEPTVIDGVLYGTDKDEILNAREYGVTHVHAGYGDDTVIGTAGDDVLFGGHGEDRLEGGDGDDLLVSYADGREPEIAQDYTREDDPDGEIDPTTRTYYSEQPIEGDDVMIGGGGADTFYFRTLINAKRDIILQHVNDDGTINWGMNGVAGENDNVHDHWVERLGDEVIWDFNRAEGDTILIEGHTTEVYQLEHQDTDGDGILDASVLHIWSNQGNGGGAHNKDLLGTITVFGDLVMQSDYTVNKTDYGIVETIDELDEALAPRVFTSIGETPTPAPTPHVDDGELPDGGVFGVIQEVEFSGESGDHLEVNHSDALELEQGTIALSFNADNVWGRRTLFSKDYSGNRDGGDLSAFIRDGRLEVRFQSAEKDVWLKTEPGSIEEGQDYDLAITFGADGFGLYLDGQLVSSDSDFTQGLEGNTNHLAIGANTWARDDSKPHWTWDYFDGQISDFVIYDYQLNPHDRGPLVATPVMSN